MTGWMWALVLKPFGVLLLCLPGAAVLWLIRRKMLDGRLKRFLTISWKV